MIVELRPKSQVTIPSEVIKELSLSIGDKFEVIVKDGVLMFIPVILYPKSYVEKLEKEIDILKKGIDSGKVSVFNSVDDMCNDLDK